MSQSEMTAEHIQKYKVARKAEKTSIYNTLDLRMIGKISFHLYSEVEQFEWPHIPFRIEGEDLELEDETNEEACFEYAPVDFGEYDLIIAEAVFRIPVVPLSEPPHPVHISYDALTEIIGEWDGPTEEELQDDEEDEEEEQETENAEW